MLLRDHCNCFLSKLIGGHGKPNYWLGTLQLPCINYGNATFWVATDSVSFLFAMLFSLLTDILYCIMKLIQKLLFWLSLIRKCVQAYHKNVEVTKILMWYVYPLQVFNQVDFLCRDMRLQFGTLLADIGLIDLPKDSMVCLLHRIGRLCFNGMFGLRTSLLPLPSSLP